MNLKQIILLYRNGSIGEEPPETPSFELSKQVDNLNFTFDEEKSPTEKLSMEIGENNTEKESETPTLRRQGSSRKSARRKKKVEKPYAIIKARYIYTKMSITIFGHKI